MVQFLESMVQLESTRPVSMLFEMQAPTAHPVQVKLARAGRAPRRAGRRGNAPARNTSLSVCECVAVPVRGGENIILV